MAESQLGTASDDTSHPAMKPKASFWVLCIAAGAGLGTALARATPIYDPDYFWHLETGEWIARHAAIPRIDSFSHSFFGQPWLFVDWLADLWMAGLYAGFGHAGNILVFCAAAGLAVAGWSYRLGRAHKGSALMAVAAVAALLAAATVFRVAPRPQTLTLPLLAAVLHLVLATGSETTSAAARRAWWAVPLVTLWQNLHSSALLGWLALLAAAVGASLDSRWRPDLASPRAVIRTRWLQAVAGAAALCVAPAPLDRLAAGFLHLGDDRVPAILMEWAPLWRDGWAPARSGWGLALALLTLLAVTALAQSGTRRRLSTAHWLMALGFLVIGTRTVRFVPMAALALAPVALAGAIGLLEHAQARLARLGAAVAMVALLLTGLAAAQHHARPLGLGIAPGDFPEGAAAYLKSQPLQGPMYNDFFDGGFLLWALQRRHPVLIDGRAMAVYGVAFVARIFDQSPGDLGKLLDEFRCGFAVLYNDQRVRDLQAKPGWVLTWLDDRAVVGVHVSSNPQLAAREGYYIVHPADLANDFRQWQADKPLANKALAEAKRMVDAAPWAAIPRVVQATAQLALGEVAAASESTAAALARKPDSLPAARTAAMVCDAQGNQACVCEFTARVLRRVPHQAVARELANRHKCAPP